MWLNDLARSLLFNELERISLADLRAWMDGLIGRGLKPHSIDGAYRTARAFFRWCVAEGLRPDDPTVRLERPSLPRRVPKPLPPEVIQQLINVAAGSKHPQRDMALVMFMTETGCRLGELCGLQPSAIDLGACCATVIGKGDQERWVFFSEETSAAITAWLAIRPAKAKNLFDIGYYGVGELLKRLAERANLSDVRVHPHAFRKTAATHYAETLDPHTLMQLFGWKELKTSENYVFHSRARLAKRVRAALHVEP
jgi:site-specific recombinase XerD